jgi:hypothetical protein
LASIQINIKINDKLINICLKPPKPVFGAGSLVHLALHPGIPWDSLGFPNGALISEAFHELHHSHGTSCDDHQII